MASGTPHFAIRSPVVLEIKARPAFSDVWFERELETISTTPVDTMFSGFAGDFQKLLDPKLPKAAFRYSWAVARKRGSMTPKDVATWARRLMEPVEERLVLTGFQDGYDQSMQCRRWTWQDGAVREPRLVLAEGGRSR